MKPNHLPRDPPPSVIFVLITLIMALACTFGSVLLMLRVMRWWVGLWS